MAGRIPPGDGQGGAQAPVCGVEGQGAGRADTPVSGMSPAHSASLALFGQARGCTLATAAPGSPKDAQLRMWMGIAAPSCEVSVDVPSTSTAFAFCRTSGYASSEQGMPEGP